MRQTSYRRFLPSRIFQLVLAFCFCFLLLGEFVEAQSQGSASQAVYVITIDGPISPATDDYLKSALLKASEAKAQLFVVKLNTPGGLLNSMQTMVASLLEAPLPTAVYVTPSGGGAMSAGVFITMAGHFAVMSPGTTIGAAHPVLGSGGDVQGDMREKIENFTVSLIKAIAQERGRNMDWAEKAVRESVAITDREAVSENVVDFTASTLDKLLTELEGKTVTIKGNPITLRGVSDAPIIEVEMNLKQQLANILCDPNIAILLGLGALLGLGIELYNPGLILPGVTGLICLILSLTAGQVLPISDGGLALLLVGVLLFIVEMKVPSFGVWGASGLVCIVLGSIYFVDSDKIWSTGGFEVNKWMIGFFATTVGGLLSLIAYFAVKATNQRVTSGADGLVGQIGSVSKPFAISPSGRCQGKIKVLGEIWNARVDIQSEPLLEGESIEVLALEPGMMLLVKRK